MKKSRKDQMEKGERKKLKKEKDAELARINSSALERGPFRANVAASDYSNISPLSGNMLLNS